MKGTHLTVCAGVMLLGVTLFVSAQAPAPAAATERPLPDVNQLMNDVETHQRASESLQKRYLYHEDAKREDEKGRVVESAEFDVFWSEGVQVRRLTRKNGRDLSEDEKKKEDKRIDEEVAKAKERKQKAIAKDQTTDSNGREKVTVSRFLLLGRFSNPRRIQINSRDTIAIDYTGDRKAKTVNRLEDVIRNLAGTIWVDEQDRTIMKLEGRFANSYKIGGGLVMNIKKDTSFVVVQKKINDEVWLPAEVTGRGAARVLLFVNFNGGIHVIDSDYRKFQTSSTILPGVGKVEEETPSPTATQPPQE